MHGNRDGGSTGYNQQSSDEYREYDGRCPKCGHEEIRYNPHTTPPVGEHAFFVEVQTIWCGHCGYTEWYQDDGNGSPVDWFAETDEE